MSINKAILIGHVGKDPDIKTIEAGRKVANLTLATTEKGYTLQNGTQVPERTEWHNVVIWGNLAEVVEKYVRKGSQLYVEGKIQTRSWEKDGIKHYRTEINAESIQMLGAKKEATGTQSGPAAGFSQQSGYGMHEPVKAPPIGTPWTPIDGDIAKEDDLPF